MDSYCNVLWLHSEAIFRQCNITKINELIQHFKMFVSFTVEISTSKVLCVFWEPKLKTSKGYNILRSQSEMVALSVVNGTEGGQHI
jgi:hypothetical protein